MATATPPSGLLTAEQFAARLDPGYPEELVRGRIIRTSPPGARYGQICCRVAGLLGNHAGEYELGHVLCNRTGVITGRDPDSVRGADISFYSYARLLAGPLTRTYPEVPPDLVVEVRSPGVRWSKVILKVAEFLEAGVAAVCVLDDGTRTAQVFGAEPPVRTLTEADDLAFPELLPGFRVAVRRFFA